MKHSTIVSTLLLGEKPNRWEYRDSA